MPSVYAKEEIPFVAFEGSVKMILGAAGFMKRGEAGSLN